MLNSYQISLPCALAPSGGSTGSVDHMRINATTCTFAGPDPACLIDGYQNNCINSQLCFSPADCSGNPCSPDPMNPGVSYCQNSGVCQNPSPFIDTTLVDFVFGGQGGVTTNPSPGNCPSILPFIAASMPAGQGVTLNSASGPKYLGSFRYRVSNCAAGVFTAILQGNGNPPTLTDISRLVDQAGSPVLITPAANIVTIDVGLCCNGLTCLGDYNSYCCANIQGGTYSDLAKTCAGGNPDPCICTQTSHCNDNSVCTNDSCNPGSGQANQNGCILAPNYPAGNCCNPSNGQLDPLNDGNVCTLDYCQNGTYPAVHDAPAANGFICQDDGNTCTFDYCNNGSCTHPNKPYGTSCSPDTTYCTWDVCNNGACTHTDINTIACTTVAQCPPAPLTDSCTGGFCVCTTPAQPCFGDIRPLPNGDGYCDLTDLLCCLQGYALTSNCPEADIAPCTPDGLVELLDVLWFLDGYANTPQCGREACNQ